MNEVHYANAVDINSCMTPSTSDLRALGIMALQYSKVRQLFKYQQQLPHSKYVE